MIRLIEALNFRCLRYISQPLGPFQVLVGPNASGKTTFLDVVSFLGKLATEGPREAVEELAQNMNMKDLVWNHKGDCFELAIEAAIPQVKRSRLDPRMDTIRYEVRIGLVQDTQELGIIEEKVLLEGWKARPPKPRTLFPAEIESPRTILRTKGRRGNKTVMSKGNTGRDNYYPEVREVGRWYPSIELGRDKSVLGSLHEDETRFPASTWLKRLLTQGVQSFVLNSLLIRKPSPPGQRGFKPDGSNLPWVIADLKKNKPRFMEWINHVRTALPEIEDIQTIERQDDRHRYLKICYKGGLEVPSWLVSDGTLRLLALTLPAYLPDFTGIYLIEEPENGIHPRAVETVYKSLSSAYEAQIVTATHSPIILSLTEPEKILCFKKTADGATDIVLGSNHPALRDWQGQPNLSVLFASGVLG
jgi:predicted ATPase